MLIRILFIVGAVPRIGIQGYLWGLLAAYLVLVFLEIRRICQFTFLPFSPSRSILIPVLLGLLSAVIAHMGEFYLGDYLPDMRLLRLAFGCMLLFFTYAGGILLLDSKENS